MSEYIIKGETLTGIADAIRAKDGTTEPIPAGSMAERVMAMKVSDGSAEAMLAGVIDKTVVNLVIPEATKHLSSNAFASYTKLETVIINAPFTSLPAQAFQYCSSLQSIVMPDTITEISSYAFRGCTALAIVKLPSNLKYIMPDAFNNCYAIQKIKIPSSMLRLLGDAFRNCTGLTEVTFEGKPNDIYTAFNGCTNLLTINVPWAEGEVANAPWGAANATINYNYTGG